MQGNNIGTDVTGEVALGNFTGVSVLGGDGNLLGGAVVGEGNLVSGNLSTGVQIGNADDDPARENDVQGNLIGTNVDGDAPLPNFTGLRVLASDHNNIGGTDPGTGNVISGNDTDGVKIQADGADDNDVQGNWIGTDKDETVALGNGESGVEILDGAQNLVGATGLQNPANVIAHNGGDGVTVTNSDGNAIVRNSLRDNGDLGIDLDANGVDRQRRRPRSRLGRQYAAERPGDPVGDHDRRSRGSSRPTSSPRTGWSSSPTTRAIRPAAARARRSSARST